MDNNFDELSLRLAKREGKIEKSIEIAMLLIAKGFPDEDISEICELDIEKIQKLRKEEHNNLNQEEFGKLFNVSQNTVSVWEQNQAKPDTDQLIAIVNKFDVSLYDLLGIEIDKMLLIKRLMNELGMMTGDNLTQEELEKALKIIQVLKEEKNN